MLLEGCTVPDEYESYTRILRHGLLLVWQQGAGAGMETNGLPPESALASSRSIDYDYLLKRDAATKRTGELTMASYEYLPSSTKVA